MKKECEVVRDLMPLYVEKLTRSGSDEFIENHITSCEECKEVLNELKDDITDNIKQEEPAIKEKGSIKLVKRIRKRMTAIIAIAVVISLFIGAFGSAIYKISSNRRAAKTFLENITASNFEKAFQYVSYYDVASDIEPEISYQDAKTIWVRRMNHFKERNIYVVGYKKLKVWTDDSYPEGSVMLEIMDGGRISTYECNIHFNSLKGKWKVQNIEINSNGNKNISNFEIIMSGHIVGGEK